MIPSFLSYSPRIRRRRTSSSLIVIKFLLIYVIKSVTLLDDATTQQQQHAVVATQNLTTTKNEALPVPQALQAAALSGSGVDDGLPIFPERPDAVYFIVAVRGGGKLWGRTLARTLLDLGAPFDNPQGPPLRPIYLDMPTTGRFSSKTLTRLCDQIENKPMAGVLVFGEGQAARSLSFAGTGMKLPVLWAKGGIAKIHGIGREIQTNLQAMLQPSSKEILEAIRALLLQTHWHSFFVLSDMEATMVLSSNIAAPLKQKPLVPKILPISFKKEEIFRQLARISRSTRGIVILLCDLKLARVIMSEAQRLNMVGGHFIWVWADTSTNNEFFDQVQDPDEVEMELAIDDNLGLIPTFEHERQRERNFEPTLNREQIRLFDDDVMNPPPMPPIKQKTNPFEHRSEYETIKGLEEDHFNINEDLLERREDFDADFESYGRFGHNLSHELQLGPDGSYNPFDHQIGVGYGKRMTVPESTVDVEENEYGELNLEKLNLRTRRNPFLPFMTTYNGKTNKYSINNNNDDVNSEENLMENANDVNKIKRVNLFVNQFEASSGSQHVLFHNFQDFPIGLLTLRPIKMLQDRHFIRAAVKLFATTWAKLERNNYGGSGSIKDDIDKPYRFKNNRNKREEQTNNQANTPVNSQIWEPEQIITQKQQTSGLSDVKSNKFISTSSSLSTNNVNTNTAPANDAINIAMKNKRFDTSWWSSIGASPTNREKEKTGKDKQKDKGKQTGEERIKNRGTPQYKGGCFGVPTRGDIKRAELFARHLRADSQQALVGDLKSMPEKTLVTHFEVLNLVPMSFKPHERFNLNVMHQYSAKNVARKWRRVGLISGRDVRLDTIVWPGGDIVVSGVATQARSVFRIVTALAPPFVMESGMGENGVCLRGLACHRITTSGKQNLTLMFNTIETRDRLEEDALQRGNQFTEDDDGEEEKLSYKTKCCYGLSMDLLAKVASDLGFEFHLYIVRDELFGGTRDKYGDSMKFGSSYWKDFRFYDRLDIERQYHMFKENEHIYDKHYYFEYEKQRFLKMEQNKAFERLTTSQWNGIIGDLATGAADMSFAPLSVSKARAEVIDFSAPYFHSGVSLLAAPQSKSDIPLLAFLLPFSPELWIAIFTSLHITAVAVAVYEWLSPFGLNPWGRQRSKNFSLSSALWVMWGLLCGHVSFKAPKSWPNKFLINIWGGFSVIFIASYTANIAALIAGLFFYNTPEHYDASLLAQRVGAPISSVAEYYVQRNDRHLWEHMKKYPLQNVEEGILRLKNGTLDLLMADAPILDYYRATDHGCSLKRIGDVFVEDTYAIGMKRGFPLKDSISSLISKYSSNGYLDILTEKWYGGLPCFNKGVQIIQPRPLGVAAVAGVFCLLGLGMVVGVLILFFEHGFYKWALPHLRLKPKGTIWRSRNIMFFSQKLYRFINCVELVSPHHAARELVNTLRQGQITSLFQKSIKRKEDEQRRRRRSKAQFFEMIQEIRRVQQEEREQPLPILEEVVESVDAPTTSEEAPIASAPLVAAPKVAKLSPRPKMVSKSKSDLQTRSASSSLNLRRSSNDSLLEDRLGTIGRRLSRDITDSPPDLIHRFETFGKGSVPDNSKFDTFAGVCRDSSIPELSKYDTFSGVIDDRPEIPMKKGKKYQSKRTPLNLDIYERDRHINDTLSMSDSLYPPIFKLDRTKAVLRERVHNELKSKYPTDRTYIVKRPQPITKQSQQSTHKTSSGSRATPSSSQAHMSASASSVTNIQDKPLPPIPPHQVEQPPPPPPKTPIYATSLKKQKKSKEKQREVPQASSRKSLENLVGTTSRSSSLNTRTPKAAPRSSKSSLDIPPRLPPKTSPKSRTSNMSLGKLSKEDLLKLSQSSELEIHQFLHSDHHQHHHHPP